MFFIAPAFLPVRIKHPAPAQAIEKIVVLVPATAYTTLEATTAMGVEIQTFLRAFAVRVKLRRHLPFHAVLLSALPRKEYKKNPPHDSTSKMPAMKLREEQTAAMPSKPPPRNT